MTVGTATLPAGSTAAQAHAEELPGELTPTLDSVVFPAFVREHQDERRVRPALAVLFRIAVGPHADYYAHRFVKYERTGHSVPSWHWPSIALPTIWAFSRWRRAYGAATAVRPREAGGLIMVFAFHVGGQ